MVWNMVNEIKGELLYAALEEVNSGTVRVDTEYSGRAMYGDRCLGLVGSFGTIMEAVARLTIRMTEELDDESWISSMCSRMRMVILGNVLIVYFPGWKVVGWTEMMADEFGE